MQLPEPCVRVHELRKSFVIPPRHHTQPMIVIHAPASDSAMCSSWDPVVASSLEGARFWGFSVFSGALSGPAASSSGLAPMLISLMTLHAPKALRSVAVSCIIAISWQLCASYRPSPRLTNHTQAGQQRRQAGPNTRCRPLAVRERRVLCFARRAECLQNQDQTTAQARFKSPISLTQQKSNAQLSFSFWRRRFVDRVDKSNALRAAACFGSDHSSSVHDRSCPCTSRRRQP